MLKIAITGPESTGKTSLAKALAHHYQTIHVPEYARDYIEQLNRPYTQEDILKIAQGQQDAEKALLQKAGEILICDTELLVTKIWSAHAFQSVPEWIEDNLHRQTYDLYLLMDIDLPWEPDPQREHPDKRAFFFDWYERELRKMQVNYVIISGQLDQRTQSAIQKIDLLKQKRDQKA
ncbi:MAG: ATP-binding protein [Bacteroidota bacterium]